jgi:hypothetical protein
MRLPVEVFRSMGSEFAGIFKEAGYSSPSIVAPPVPGGDGRSMSPKPAKPITPQKLVGKVVQSKTNIQKTNYTKPNTEVVTPDLTQAAEQKAVPPPAVRS